MHLNKILEQIKRHQSPSEAIDKLSTQMGLVCCHEYDLFRLLQSSRCYDWQRKYQTLRRIGKSLAM